MYDMSVRYVQADERERGVHELPRELELVGCQPNPCKLHL
jgi:hypothetical protein